MNRQRYEPIPQNPDQDVIILDSIHSSSSYNYNSGTPTSVAASQYTPSIIAPSIPASPPPSFHTYSTPGTPRQTPSTTTLVSQPGYAAETLWGVAPSTSGETEITIGTSNDALATIKSLKQRVEWLEESIGRLLIEREKSEDDQTASRDNCCVFFHNTSPDLERSLMSGKGSNCCVTFKSHRAESKRKKGEALVIVLVTLIFFAVVGVTIATSGSKQSVASGA